MISFRRNFFKLSHRFFPPVHFITPRDSQCIISEIGHLTIRYNLGKFYVSVEDNGNDTLCREFTNSQLKSISLRTIPTQQKTDHPIFNTIYLHLSHQPSRIEPPLRIVDGLVPVTIGKRWTSYGDTIRSRWMLLLFVIWIQFFVFLFNRIAKRCRIFCALKEITYTVVNLKPWRKHFPWYENNHEKDSYSITKWVTICWWIGRLIKTSGWCRAISRNMKQVQMKIMAPYTATHTHGIIDVVLCYGCRWLYDSKAS